MTRKHAEALLCALAFTSCTSSATVGRLAADGAEVVEADASAFDAARTVDGPDALPDAGVFEPAADALVAFADASDEASVAEASVGCVDDRGCPGGRLCSRGACVQCVVNDDCAGREETRCDARGRCVECTSTAECLSNQVCAPWGECELTCTRDAQCLSTLRCDANFRVCLECVENADCSGTGNFCDEGVCARCAGNPDCPN